MLTRDHGDIPISCRATSHDPDPEQVALYLAYESATFRAIATGEDMHSLADDRLAVARAAVANGWTPDKEA